MATVVTSKPKGATMDRACADGEEPVSILAPKFLSSCNKSARRAAREDTHTGGNSWTSGTGGSAGIWALPST